jgi:hypothetical protein
MPTCFLCALRSFWSHDGFKKDASTGALTPAGSSVYADQNKSVVLCSDVEWRDAAH